MGFPSVSVTTADEFTIFPAPKLIPVPLSFAVMVRLGPDPAAKDWYSQILAPFNEAMLAAEVETHAPARPKILTHRLLLLALRSVLRFS
jgi:hypothetical protein